MNSRGIEAAGSSRGSTLSFRADYIASTDIEPTTVYKNCNPSITETLHSNSNMTLPSLLSPHITKENNIQSPSVLYHNSHKSSNSVSHPSNILDGSSFGTSTSLPMQIVSAEDCQLFETGDQKLMELIINNHMMKEGPRYRSGISSSSTSVSDLVKDRDDDNVQVSLKDF